MVEMTHQELELPHTPTRITPRLAGSSDGKNMEKIGDTPGAPTTSHITIQVSSTGTEKKRNKIK